MFRPGITEHVPSGVKIEQFPIKMPEDVLELLREVLRQDAMLLELNSKVIEMLTSTAFPFYLNLMTDKDS
jgi:hypothetical protein